ncbi:MAG TPA: DUF4365 domain-containing protein [Flavobacteriaceae bacterium]|nr:DUF4365 domain-containing protein [Flavobacteriaceae bacterium]HIN98061.1 DUF4365 domain-containing protein [Flavobacteriaceae bacterium]
MSKNRDSDSIESLANNFLNSLLVNLFDTNNLKLVDNEAGRREIGIDFFYQVFDRKDYTQILSFEIQNKGTDTPIKFIKQKNHPQKGNVSYSLELRHIKQYYNQITEPLIFFLCDINNQIAYWYPIQLDKTIPERIEKKELELSKKKKVSKKPKLQIYIPAENVLSLKTFENFLEDIDSAREEQTRKNNFNLSSEADFSSIVKEIEGKHIIDQAFITINKFNGMNVFPTRLIPKLPFLSKTKYGASLDSFRIKTDHDEFFSLIENLTLVNRKLVYSEGDNLVAEQDEKLKGIMNFLKANFINHLDWGGRKYRKRICIHDLFIYNECDCARCEFDSLNFIESNTKINKELEVNNLTSFEQLRNAYAAYLLGDLRTSSFIFNSVYKKSELENNLVISSICKYNLKQIKRLVKNNYYENDKEQILKSFKFGDLDNDEVYIKRKAPYFLDVYYWLRDDKFYSSATWDIDGFVEDAKKMHFYDKHGTSYSNEKSDEIIASFIRFYSFLEYNFIIFDYFTDYHRLATKFLECIFALSNIVNPESCKFDKFSTTIIRLWLFYVPMDKAKILMHIYGVKKIKPDDEVGLIKTFEEFSNNLLKSAIFIKESSNLSHFESKVKRIVSNLFLICSRLDVSSNIINKIIAKLFKAINKIEHFSIVPFDAIKQLLDYRDDISKENIKTILDICARFDYRVSSSFSLAIKHYVELSSESEIRDFVFDYLGISNFDEQENIIDEKKIEDIAYAISTLDKSTLDIVKQRLITILKESFSARLFHIAIIFDLIDYEEELFKKFVNTVPDHSKEHKAGSFLGSYDNFRLSQVVNVIFKENIPLTQDLKELANNSSKEYKQYYTWLLDIDNYDYSNFEPIWVLKHNTKFYIQRFKESKKLKKELKVSLKEQYIEGVAQFYINHLA